MLHLLPPPSDEREELLALLRSTALLRHPVRQLPPLLANVRSALGVPASWGNAERQRDEYVAECVEALYGHQVDAAKAEERKLSKPKRPVLGRAFVKRTPSP